MSEVHQLLARYAETRSEPAFQEVVHRYINLVYSTALRLVNGDTHSAEDLAQRVFADLAKVAGNFSQDSMIGGWLHRHTCYLAKKHLRSERRRKAREEAAMEIHQNESDETLRSMAPVLDEAINGLKAEDRQAIMLRFFEQQDYNTVGANLGTSEEAARKRVTRAVEKLRERLMRRGITLSAAAIGATLASSAIHAAPVGLAASVTSAAISTAVVGGGTATIILELTTMSKVQVTMIAAIALVATVPLAFQYQQNTKLREETATLRAELQQMNALKQENQRLARLVETAPDPVERQDLDQYRELLRLRGEVGALRKSVKEAAAAPKPVTDSPLSGITQSPEMWQMMRDQQKMGLSAIYKSFGQQTKLDAPKLEQLGNLLADDVMTNIHHITAMLRDGKSGEEMEAVFAQQEADLDAKVKALLGEEGLNQFKDYNRKLISFLTAEQFKSMLPGDKAARDAAAKQLLQLMEEETQRAISSAGLGHDYQLVPTLNFRNFASEQEAEKNLQLLDSVYAQVQSRSAAFLNPEGVEKFGEFRKMALNNNRVALAVNRQLMAPPGK